MFAYTATHTTLNANLEIYNKSATHSFVRIVMRQTLSFQPMEIKLSAEYTSSYLWPVITQIIHIFKQVVQK